MLGLHYLISEGNIFTITVPESKVEACLKVIEELTVDFERDKSRINVKLLQKALGKAHFMI